MKRSYYYKYQKIKNLILSISTILIVQHSFAQPYLPIVSFDDTTQFSLVHEIWDVAFTETASVYGESEIDGKIYNNVIYEQFPSIIGYIRQDSTNSKAWYRSIEENNEYLIMDLNLNVGDTFSVNYIIYGSEEAVVTKIDTFQNRKRVTLNYEYGGGFISDTISFIEGIGPNTFFLYQVENIYSPVDQLFGFLTCKKYKNGVLEFEYDPNDNDCIYFTSTKDKIYENKIFIYPNPTKDSFTISISPKSNIENLNYKLFDQFGRGIKSSAINNEYTKVSISQKGMIYLVILDNHKIIKTDKIIVN